MKIGILSGHDMKDLFEKSEEIKVDTVYGSVQFVTGVIGDHQVFFVNRHGIKANIPPHKVNYRANMDAFHAAHVDCIVSIGTVGSMNKQIMPGDFVIPHDFFDATKSRSLSFFDDSRVHVDMTDPFCPYLRAALIQSCENNKEVTVHKNGVQDTGPYGHITYAFHIRFPVGMGKNRENNPSKRNQKGDANSEKPCRLRHAKS